MPINNDIYEGLRNALSRGYSLKQAMLGFHNAGYKKEEIEEAARALHEHPSHPLSHPQKSIQIEQTKSIPLKTPISTTQPQTPQQPMQTVSKYGEEKPKASPWIMVIIVILFFILIGLIGSLIFREEIIKFFNNLF